MTNRAAAVAAFFYTFYTMKSKLNCKNKRQTK